MPSIVQAMRPKGGPAMESNDTPTVSQKNLDERYYVWLEATGKGTSWCDMSVLRSGRLVGRRRRHVLIDGEKHPSINGTALRLLPGRVGFWGHPFHTPYMGSVKGWNLRAAVRRNLFIWTRDPLRRAEGND